MTWNQWCLAVQRETERYLSWRRTRKARKKERQKKKNPVLDWVEAILSAVLIVLVINQFLLQAYQIPSESMLDTLRIGDRIFVNKLIYGPELLPGIAKLRGFRTPRRGEIIIFENPSYISTGVAKDVLQRIVYMLTLSLIDIDRDADGKPKVHFLVKRAIGMPGDRLRMNQGNVEILPLGANAWMREEELKSQLGLIYHQVRTIRPEAYGEFRRLGVALARAGAGLPPADSAGSRSQPREVDNFEVSKWQLRTLYAIAPYSQVIREKLLEPENGWYISADRLFPMGDNRDNSRDARYFDPVRMTKVLGRALFRYWPLTRFGGVR